MKQKLFLLAAFLLSNSFFANAQCTKIIPANTLVISSDTTLNCGNASMINRKILICPGATLFLRGNSTCSNSFYLESGATLSMNDTAGIAPYGVFDFYLKSGSTLKFNETCGYSFPIDSLFYESGAIMIDTGHMIMNSMVCSPLIFDYSLLPTGSNCVTNVPSNFDSNNFSVGVFPNPFSESVSFLFHGKSTEKYWLSVYDFSGKKIYSVQVSSNENISLSKNVLTGGCFLWRITNSKNEVAGKGVLIRED